MHFYGVSNDIICCLKEYLNNRLQSVCINNVQSTFLNVTSGVPQGSVLGPLQFNIYINDLVDVCAPITPLSDVYLYADDAKFFSSDKSELQLHLSKAESFTNNHQLSLAPAKCQYLPIKRKGSVNNNYFLGDRAILCTSTVKDLGILISSDLKWSPHIAQIVRNALFCSHHIWKTFSNKNIWTLMKAFVTHVQSKLEYWYNTSVWSPHLKSNIKSIESVQKVFTRRACIRCNIPFFLTVIVCTSLI